MVVPRSSGVKMFKFLSSLFSNSSNPHPEAKWNYRKASLFAVIIANQKCKGLSKDFDTIDKVADEICRWEYEVVKPNDPIQFDKLFQYSHQIVSCYPRNRSRSEGMLFFWTKRQRDKAMKNWQPTQFIKHCRFVTFEEYYSSLEVEMRYKVIELEKLSDKDLIAKVLQLCE
jgi:hypothetical protein